MKGTWLAILAVAMLAACNTTGGGTPGGGTDAMTDEPTTSMTRPPFGSMPPLESGPLPSGGREDVPDEVWAAVLDDLAERVGRRVEDPTVVGAGAVTYNDGSLGCPQPGQAYTQAIVEGYRVVLEVDGQEYDYRIGRQPSSLVLCESGSTLGDGSDS